MLGGFVVAVKRAQRRTDVVFGRDVVGCQAQRTAVVVDGVGVASQRLQHQTEIVFGFGVIGLDRQCRRIMGESGFFLPVQAQRDPEGVVRLSEIRFLVNGLAEKVDRLLNGAPADADQPEIEPRLEVVRVSLQHRAIEPFGFGQPTAPLQRQRVAKIAGAGAGSAQSAKERQRHDRKSWLPRGNYIRSAAHCPCRFR